MDDRTLKTQKERLARLDRQLGDLAVKQRRVEKQLADEHDAVRKCVSQRVGVVSQLVDADPQTAAKLHKQLDSIDATITSSERMSESYQQLLRNVKDETANVTSERDKVNEIVASENNSREFQAWRESIQQGIEDSTQKLADARLALGALSIHCARGIERFGAAASILGEQIDKFITEQANPENKLNFRLATPFYRNDLRIMIYPMVVKG